MHQVPGGPRPSTMHSARRGTQEVHEYITRLVNSALLPVMKTTCEPVKPRTQQVMSNGCMRPPELDGRTDPLDAVSLATSRIR